MYLKSKGLLICRVFAVLNLQICYGKLRQTASQTPLIETSHKCDKNQYYAP